MPNILKHGVGQLNDVIDHKGIRRVRADKLLFKVGENTMLIDCVYDESHLLYQNQMPIEKDEYERYRKGGTKIPANRLGANVMCSCGAAGVLIVDPNAPLEWQNKLICENVARFGIHQTAMVVSDGKMKLPEKLEQDFIMTENERLRSMKNDGE